MSLLPITLWAVRLATLVVHLATPVVRLVATPVVRLVATPVVHLVATLVVRRTTQLGRRTTPQTTRQLVLALVHLASLLEHPTSRLVRLAIQQLVMEHLASRRLSVVLGHSASNPKPRPQPQPSAMQVTVQSPRPLPVGPQAQAPSLHRGSPQAPALRCLAPVNTPLSSSSRRSLRPCRPPWSSDPARALCVDP